MKKFLFLFILFVLSFSINFANASFDWNDNNTTVKITRFYPNPASSYINFEFQSTLEKGCTLQLFNSIGKKINEIEIKSNKLTITLENYYRGIYFFLVCDKYGKILDSAKFQVVK